MELLDMKIMTPKMKDSLDGINNILDSAKEKTWEDTAVETIQSKANGKKRLKKKIIKHL